MLENSFIKIFFIRILLWHEILELHIIKEITIISLKLNKPINTLSCPRNGRWTYYFVHFKKKQKFINNYLRLNRRTFFLNKLRRTLKYLLSNTRHQWIILIWKLDYRIYKYISCVHIYVIVYNHSICMAIKH